jgi:hypothetical protein
MLLLGQRPSALTINIFLLYGSFQNSKLQGALDKKKHKTLHPCILTKSYI